MFFSDLKSVQEVARQTNTTYPVRDYIDSTGKFPTQNPNMLGKEVEVKIRNYNFMGMSKEDILYRVTTLHAYILRYDTTYPFICMAIVTRGHRKGSILLFDRKSDDTPLFDCVAYYPTQKYNYYMYNTKDVYIDYSFVGLGTPGMIMRCDEGEPSFSVVAEIFDGFLRFILSDEAICIVEQEQTTTIQYKEKEIYDIVEELLGEYRLYGSSEPNEDSSELNSESEG